MNTSVLKNIVPIQEIELDMVMVNTLKEINADIELSSFTLKTRFHLPDKQGKLTRMKRMMSGMSKGVEYDPIQVVIHQRGGYASYVPPRLRKMGKKSKNVQLITSYSVINGRHRVVARILHGYTRIHAIISPR